MKPDLCRTCFKTLPTLCCLFLIYACNGSDNENNTVKTADTVPPSNVSNLAAIPGDSQIQLNWINPTVADFSHVIIRRATGNPPVLPTDGDSIFNGLASQFTDTNLINGTSYSYSVFSVDEAQNISSGVSVTETPTTQSPPQGLAAGFGTYLGGTFFERAQSVYVDNSGFIFVGGHTQSDNFPVTAGAYDTSKSLPSGNGPDTQDGYVVKLSPDGANIIWATLIGGTRRDQVYSVRTDSTGNVYLLGATGSNDFPTTEGAYDQTFNGPPISNGITDIFVASLSADGSTLRFSTFIGGSLGGEENPRGAFEIDESRGRIYVAGQTSAADFPTTASAYQPNYGGGSEDAFVFALSIDGSTLVASTFFGGSGSDTAFAEIEAHPSGNSFYIGGATNSANFPITAGAFQGVLASGSPSQPWWQGGDAFVARLSADLDNLIFSTYFGGAGADAVSHNQGLAVDSQGNVIIIGHTKSIDLPIPTGAVDNSLDGVSDGFVAIFSETGALIDATYIGGSDTEEVAGVFVGPLGKIYITGGTRSDDFFVTSDAYQPTFGNINSGGGLSDAFLTVFNPQLNGINYSTFLGGNGMNAGAERGRTVWVNNNGLVVVGGVTDSSNFPINAPSVQSQFGGYTDAFVMAFDPL